MGNHNPPNQWKKGQSGNPSGRPKKVFRYADELNYQLTLVDPNDERKRTNGQIIVEKQITLAKQGSIRAVNEILDRLYGKPPQAVAISDLRPQNRDEAIAALLNAGRELQQLQQPETTDDGETIQ